jgi:hypothetical protein
MLLDVALSAFIARIWQSNEVETTLIDGNLLYSGVQMSQASFEKPLPMPPQCATLEYPGETPTLSLHA